MVWSRGEHTEWRKNYKISCSIGEFQKVYYKSMLNKYSYHRMLLCLLGKHKCKNLEENIFFRQ